MFVDLWWFLALPLLFGLGWFAARLEARDSRRRHEGLPDAYFKGLNFLLNEQADKAADAFVEVVRIEPETVELHFALGSLFRRRGETERAIRVHQNLVERPDLSDEQRENALFELGQDYLKAGLIDRAEDAFNRLEGSRYQAAALGHRLRIAQMVRDWPQAIDIATRLAADGGGSRGPEIAQFHCEQAGGIVATAELDADPADPTQADVRLVAAGDALTRAMQADPSHPRPLLMQGELRMAAGDPEGAIDAWDRAFEIAPRHAALVARPWLAAHEQVGRLEAGIERLESLQRQVPSVDVLGALYDAISARDGPAKGREWLEQALPGAPSLVGYQKLLEARVALEPADGTQREQLQLAQMLIKRQVDRLSRYVCGRCGFSARQYYWQCPGCSQWDTYTPRRAEELERP